MSTDAPQADVSTYRWSRAALLRPLGAGVAALGAMWVVLAVVLGATSTSIGTALPIAAVITAICLAGACWLLLRPPPVLQLSDVGYRVRHVRGAGVTSATWSQVETVDARTTPAGAVIVVDLSDGTSSILPLALLGNRGTSAQREMHERLNQAFGYRRLREAAAE
jgi:hypothetical protein